MLNAASAKSIFIHLFSQTNRSISIQCILRIGQVRPKSHQAFVPIYKHADSVITLSQDV
jgi:hypothetical protein